MSWDIIQTDSFGSVKKLYDQADQKSLCVFDVDQVLIDPKDAVLSAVGEAIKTQNLKQIHTDHGQEVYDYYYSILVKERQVDLVDALVKETISDLQKRQLPTIALTAFWDGPYGVLDNIGDFRVQQLLNLGYDFSKSQPLEDQLFQHLDSGREGLYPSLKDGIALTCYVSKGEVLKAYINQMNDQPNHVIFIDDRLSFIEQVINACKEMNIPCTAIHYLAAEKNGKVLNEPLAHFQWQYFVENKTWLSDEEAINHI